VAALRSALPARARVVAVVLCAPRCLAARVTEVGVLGYGCVGLAGPCLWSAFAMTASLSVFDLRFGQGDSQGWTFMILDCAPAPWVIGRFSSHKRLPPTFHAGLPPPSALSPALSHFSLCVPADPPLPRTASQAPASSSSGCVMADIHDATTWQVAAWTQQVMCHCFGLSVHVETFFPVGFSQPFASPRPKHRGGRPNV
jgi:hypothetical protein